MKFIDEAKIQVFAGKGGDGSAAFRREKYVPRGGPSGGDGGHGGSVYIVASPHTNTLINFRFHPEFSAERGEHGMGNDRSFDGDGGEAGCRCRDAQHERQGHRSCPQQDRGRNGDDQQEHGRPGRGLSLEVRDEAKDQLAEVSFDPQFGARPLKRAIQRHLEDPLARRVLAGEFLPGTIIVVSAQNGELTLTPARAAAA